MPDQSWDAVHSARAVFSGLEGDVRVQDDTILVTYDKPLVSRGSVG